MTMHQIAVLLHFNQSKKFGFKELQSSTGIETPELSAILRGFVEMNLIESSTEDFTDVSCLEVNGAFTKYDF